MNPPTAHNSPPFYQLARAVAVSGFLLAMASFSFRESAALLCFYFFFCWSIWVLFAVFAGQVSKARLFGLWLTIDLSVLLMFVSVASALGDVQRSNGIELVWFWCYAPITIPTAYLFLPLSPLVNWVNTATVSMSEQFLGPIYGTVIGNWVCASFFAAAQANLLVFTTSKIRRWINEPHA